MKASVLDIMKLYRIDRRIRFDQVSFIIVLFIVGAILGSRKIVSH